MITDILPAFVDDVAEPVELLKKTGLPATITRRDLIFLINKSMEGVGETKGNKIIYMFYWAGASGNQRWWDYMGKVDEAGFVKNKDGTSSSTVTQMIPYDGAYGTPKGGKSAESTAWCGCYASFVMVMSGILGKRVKGGPRPHMGAQKLPIKMQLSPSVPFKSFDMMIYHTKGSGWSGHVGFIFKGTKNNTEYVIGGNQGEMVRITPEKVYSNGKKWKATSGKPLSWYETNGHGVGSYSNPKWEEKISLSDAQIVINYLNGLTNGTIPLNQNNANLIKKEGVNIIDTNIKYWFNKLAEFENGLTLAGAPPVSQNIRSKKKRTSTKPSDKTT